VAEASGTKGRVDVIHLARMTVAQSYELAGQPFGFFIHDGLAYMTCIVTGRIEVLNLRTRVMETPIDLSPGVNGMAWLDDAR
jgi:hypothetical protein